MTKTLKVNSDSLFVDSSEILDLRVWPKYKNSPYGTQWEFLTDFTLSKDRLYLIILNKEIPDSVFVSYNVIPNFVKKSYGKIPYQKMGVMEQESGIIQNNRNTINEQREELSVDGVLSRGISFGNSQNLVLNSGLNLRLNGVIGKDIEVEAAVTDEELPFQPEGTTSTLQDFDRIYVQITKDKHQVILGDYLMQNMQEGYFLRYSKKNRGLGYTFRDDSSAVKKEIQVSMALARGRFARNEINGIEGLQGPYRLTGARGENFIIIISGTERIYLDGEKLERGLQGDYTIDYNTGEIIFNPQHLITANSRIIAEFQYSDRFYTRSVAGISSNWSWGKSAITASIFNEQDAKNQPIQQDLDYFDSIGNRTSREILSQAGDKQELAVVNAARKNEGFREGVPNYIRVDSSGFVIYRHVEKPDSSSVYYTVNFSYVGAGNGRYQLSGSASNGKIYQWVGEVNSQPLGDYEPVEVLNFANRTTMGELGWKTQLNNHSELKVMGAFSSVDQNLFSSIDDQNNIGIAGRAEYQFKKIISPKDSLNESENRYIKQGIIAEITSENFGMVERFRSAEFNRIWSRTLFNSGFESRNDQYLSHQLEWKSSKKWLLKNDVGIYKKDKFQAVSNIFSSEMVLNKLLKVKPEAEITLGNNGNNTNRFMRGSVQMEGEKNIFYYRGKWNLEQSEFKDSLKQFHFESYAFQNGNANIGIRGNKWNMEAEGTYRMDYRADTTRLINAAESWTSGLRTVLKGKPGNMLQLAIHYRELRPLDQVWNAGENKGTFNTRLEYQFSKLFKLFTGNVFYQTVNGREQKRQFSYAEVPAGNGTFRWIDYNENGIKEINEFEESPFRDQAEYIRIWVPTGTYIDSRSIGFSGNILADSRFLEKENLMEDQENKEKIYWQFRSGWNLSGQTFPGSGIGDWIPFILNAKDTHLVSERNLWRNTFEINWGKGWFLQSSRVERSQKSILTNGYEIRSAIRNFILVRKEWGGAWMLNLQLESGSGNYLSEYFSTNNYAYKTYKMDPQISLQVGKKWRFLLGGNWQIANADKGEELQRAEGNIQLLRSVKSLGFIDAKLAYVKIDYNASANTPLANEIMQGFLPGNNVRLNIDWRFKASGNIQLILGYEGRQTGEARMVHIGRAEARYLF